MALASRINFDYKILLKMEVNLDQMLEFCAYYQLNKHVAQLTI